jgi:hypothetical protein
MTVDDEVILDLLPLYRSGLASPATQRLVAAWLAAHPEFDEVGASPPQAGDGLGALAEARRLARWRRRLYGLAIGLSVLLLTTHIRSDGGRIIAVRLVGFEHPAGFAVLAVCAAAAWYGYWRITKRIIT